MILPPATIGIIGGGQLARMMVLEGRKMGYRFAVLDPDKHACAVSVCDQHIHGSWNNLNGIEKLAHMASVVTVDTEHVPWQHLDAITKVTPVYPKPQTLRCIQDRLSQREWILAQGLPQTSYRPAIDVDCIKQAGDQWGYPLVIKTRTDGYDGRGQAVIHHQKDIARVWEHFSASLCIIEAFVPFQAEVSVLFVRGEYDKVETIKCYPVAYNEHQNHILHKTIAPSGFDSLIEGRCVDIAKQVASSFEDLGLMAVEMFITKTNQVLINEIAPRPHNSGHFTYGGCDTSQFEQHIRAITGQALGSCMLTHACSVMLNLVGDQIEAGFISKVLKQPDTTLHWYDKTPAKPGRKMGHVLIQGDSRQKVKGLLAALEMCPTSNHK